eukprot:6636327-Alexandrium_andersonii.AAC.1
MHSWSAPSRAQAALAAYQREPAAPFRFQFVPPLLDKESNPGRSGTTVGRQWCRTRDTPRYG